MGVAMVPLALDLVVHGVTLMIIRQQNRQHALFNATARAIAQRSKRSTTPAALLRKVIRVVGVGHGMAIRVKRAAKLLLIVFPMVEIAVFALGLAQPARLVFVGLMNFRKAAHEAP